jgi:hypothetical protein
MPEGMEQPQDGEMPEGMEQPGDGEMPEGMEQPQNGEMPEGMEQPEDGEMPEGMEKPGNGEISDDTEQSQDSETSDDTEQSQDDTKKGKMFNFGGMGGFDEAIDGALVIAGGTITVDASGDGLDSNGSILITGGTTTVYGPENGGNGAIDYAGTMEVEGGNLYACGVSGMDQAPSDSTSQSFVAVVTDSNIAAGSEVVLQDESGTQIAAMTAKKASNYFVFSTADIVSGQTYTVSGDSVQASVTAGDTQTLSVMGGGQSGKREK